MTQKSFDLVRDARQRTLLVAHRGISGGNIPCNTIAAFDAALADGADMIELDVSRSLDGTLYVFHGGCELAHLGLCRPLTDLTDAEIRVLRYLNCDLGITEHPVYTFDDVLEHLKGRCYINVDKFALYMQPITEAIRRHGMQEQIVVKTEVSGDERSKEQLDQVEQIAPDLNYIAILQEEDNCTEQALKRNMRYIGVEAVFKSDTAPIAQESYIKRMHDLGLVVWGNAIVFSYKRVLAGGHSDDRSIQGDPEGGWGWLKDHGFDIIQTDWVLQMRHFYEKTGRV